MGFVLSSDNQYIINISSGETQLYVHKNLENFNESAASAYFNQKAEHAESMFGRYKERFISSISLSPEMKKLFDLTEENSLEREEFIQEIDDSIGKGISRALDNASIDAVLDIARGARNDYKGGVEDIQKLDKLLGYIIEASELIEQGNALSLLLSQTTDLSQLPDRLQEFLYSKEGKVVQTNNKVLNSVAKSLLSLSSKVQVEKVSEKSMSSYITNIFSTNIGEAIIALGVGRTAKKGLDEIFDQFLVGTKSVTIENEETYDGLINSTYKPDIVAKNFEVRIEDRGETFTIDLGLSGKTYASLSDSGVNIVTGKPFEQFLLMLFSDGKYHVLNTLAHLNQVNDIYRKMKKSILLTYADNFLSGTGAGTDFAQYVIINGKAYSIYNILRTITRDNVITGATSFDGNSKDPIVLSIQGAGQAQKIQNSYSVNRPSWEKAWQRSKEINSLVAGLKVHAHFRPDFLPKSIP